MDIAQAGVAFHVSARTGNAVRMLSSLYDGAEIDFSSGIPTAFDTRRPSDLMVQRFGEICFIFNDSLASTLLQGADPARVHRALGAPQILLAFKQDEAAGRFGYALFERGEHRRTRLQTSAQSGSPYVTARGAPLPFERRWLAASHYMDTGENGRAAPARIYYLGEREILVPEKRLTGRMLEDGLEALFGVCPCETLMTPSYRFCRVKSLPTGGGSVDLDDTALPVPHRPARPWWKPR